NPESNELTGLERREGELSVIEEVQDWVSPKLGIRFQLGADTLKVYYPDGRPFLSTVQLAEQAEQEKQRADQAEAENERLRALLAEAGIALGDRLSRSHSPL
ncbi:MAG: hypothetical protein VKK07_02205, partial [Merismopediaceae bacterium]|nr:hypothetical protein [Merismopediaceae bacterium]